MRNQQVEKKKNTKASAAQQSQARNASTKKANAEVIEALRLVLSDTFVLYMKTYAVHWNYQGPKFFSVHKMTEEQYGQLAEAIDAIAERIRALEKTAPISLATILASSDLEEMSRVNAGNDADLINLISSHELLARRAHEAATICGEADDVYSEDMMIQRVGQHDKAVWMLRSFLDRGQAYEGRDEDTLSN